MTKTVITGVVVVIAAKLMTAGLARATVFYVDPEVGQTGNDGSAAQPWKTIQEVFERNLIQTRGADGRVKNANAPVRPGDTILLRTGYHGEINCRGAYNDDYITIGAATGHRPTVRRVFFAAAGKWVIRGLTVSPSLAPQYARDRIIYVVNWGGPSADFVIEDNTLFSVPDASAWSAEDWNGLAVYGISVMGDRFTIRGNAIANVEYGIVMTGDQITVERNRIEHISGDGIVCSANNVSLLHNTMKYFYNVNANHRDGIQFHRGADKTTPIVNAIVHGNQVIALDHAVSNPLLTSPQGICNFDIPALNWRVENNVVLVNHSHGITIHGCQGGVIINNLSYNPYGGPLRAGILLGTSQGKTPSANSVVRNNLVDSQVEVSLASNLADHNLVVTDPNRYFQDPQNYDMRPKAGSPALDAGTDLLAPVVDIDGVQRPQGTAIDIGPHEFEVPPVPVP